MTDVSAARGVQGGVETRHEHEDDDDVDLDEELEAVFDVQTGETGGNGMGDETDQRADEELIPASPERVETPRKRPKSILDALVARRESVRLTSHAAAIAAEAAAALAQEETHARATATAAAAAAASVEAGRAAAAQVVLSGAGAAGGNEAANADGARRKLSETLGKKRRGGAGVAGPSESAEAIRERSRKARDAFRVVGGGAAASNGRGAGSGMHDVVTRNVSNMALRRAPYDNAQLSALFEYSTRVDVSELAPRYDDIRGGARLGEWVVFGCLVKKHGKRETKDGNKFAVWSIYNMPRWCVSPANEEETGRYQTQPSMRRMRGQATSESASASATPVPTMVTLLLFDDAFCAWHATAEGTAVALRRPALLPPRGTETGPGQAPGTPTDRGGAQWCGYCTRVTRRDQLVSLGVCADFQICGEPAGKGDGGTCTSWYDANRSTMCTWHVQRKRRSLTRGTRMDINNAERPAMRGETAAIIHPHGGVATVAAGATKDISRASGDPTMTAAFSADGGNAHGTSNGFDSLVIEERMRKRKLEAARVAALKRHGANRVGKSRVQMRASAQQAPSTYASASAMTAGGVMAAGRIISRGREQYERALQAEWERANGTARTATQRRYDAAVDLLLKLGFSLTVDGDLVAPSSPSSSSTSTKCPVTLRKGTAASVRPPARNALPSLPQADMPNHKDQNQDVLLSDESD